MEVYVMYGSQTGQAESIAETIHEAAEAHGINASLMDLKKGEEAFKVVTKGHVPVIFVCSTTGDGELPGNARKFMRILGRKTHPGDLLSDFRYTLLGLGDTNYSTFCGGPKTLERGLKKLGASSFYETGYADDGTDLEMVVEPWIQGLWPALKAFLLQSDKPANQDSESDVILETKTPNDVTKVELANQSSANSLSNDVNSSSPRKVDLENRSVEHDESGLSGADLRPDSTGPTSNRNGFTSQTVSPDLARSDNNLEASLQGLSLKNELNICGTSEIRKLASSVGGTLPPLMQSYIDFEVIHGASDSPVTSDAQFIPYPLAMDDNLCEAKISSMERLTTDDAVKTAYCVTLEVSNDFSYEPGDSFGVIVQNPIEEVDWLIERIDLSAKCDETIALKIDDSTKKKNPKLPNYLPKVTTIKDLLQNCLEIRSVPKRTFLRALYEFTSSEDDKNILRQLCQKESMNDFSSLVREPSQNIIDLLASLPSCKPPIQLLLEHLPRIKARLYSAASALEASPGLLKFVFNVVDFEPTLGRMYSRKGLFTGFMDSLYKRTYPGSFMGTNLTIFRTKNSSFRLPAVVDRPIVMVGPGTGVAPFIGFLERMKAHAKVDSLQTWLFYGCRHKARDFLFQKRLQEFVESNALTHLVVAFSRDTPTLGGDATIENPKYVQDNLKIRSNAVLDLLLRHNAIFYVCGDAKNMAQDVRACIVDILSQEMDKESAVAFLKTLVKDGRYKEDVWT